MRSLYRYVGMIVNASILLAICSPPAVAEPIAAIYDVNIVLKYDYRMEVYDWYAKQFTVQLRFDPATGTEVSTYGAPTFSRIPLAVAEPSGGVQLSTSKWTYHSAALDPDAGDGTYLQYALAASVTSAPNDEFYRVLSMESLIVGLTSHPEISASTFPIHLGMSGRETNLLNGYGNFLFGAYRRTGNGDERIGTAYFGDAVFRGVNPSPVPEPGTCLLVGGGLALIIRRRYRAHV